MNSNFCLQKISNMGHAKMKRPLKWETHLHCRGTTTFICRWQMCCLYAQKMIYCNHKMKKDIWVSLKYHNGLQNFDNRKINLIFATDFGLSNPDVVCRIFETQFRRICQTQFPSKSFNIVYCIDYDVSRSLKANRRW